VGSLLKALSVAHIRFNRVRYRDATSVKANLLDDGIVDTLVSIGATIALHEIPWLASLRAEYAGSSRRTGCLPGVTDALVLNTLERWTQELFLARGRLVLTSTADRHQSMIDVRP
jgi:hypothetical protein